MKRKFTKEQIEEAYVSLVSNQSMAYTLIGSSLGLLAGVVIYFLFALAGATFTILLFLPPIIVGLLGGFMGKPYEPKYKSITFIFGLATYFIGL